MATEQIITSNPSLFLEITCRSSGKVRRFAVGTEARFAVELLNRKLGSEVPHASYIEAIKEGEEPISFGPNSVIVDYGNGWKLQTVIDEGFEKEKGVETTAKKIPTVMIPDGLHPVEGATNKSKLTPEPKPKPEANSLYIGRIFVAFILIFVLGAVFTLVLENLPRLILFITSSM